MASPVKKAKKKLPARKVIIKKVFIDRLMGKLSKDEANYRPAVELRSKESCAECANYEAPGESSGTCVKVAGAIEARDKCDIFMSKGPGTSN